MKKIKEEIGRNFHTADTDPIPFDYDDNISVSIIPIQDGTWMATIKVKSNPGLSVPSRKFALESEADLYARNQVQAIRTALRNENSIREYVSHVLKNNL